MKKLYALYLLFLIGTVAKAQAPNWLWAKSAGGNSEDKAYSIASDNAGNIYVTGKFNSSSIVYGLDTFTNPTMSSWNMFLVKYDATGNIIWARRSAGSDYNVGNAVATDNAGNIYVAGYFTTNIILFDSVQLTRHDTTSFWANLFLVKYDNSGNVIWAKNTTKGASIANAVITDNLGNIFIAGDGGDTLVFGTDTLFPNSYYDYFVAKYDTAGNALWARGISAGGIFTDVDAPFIASDKYGNVCITGGFHNPTCVIVTTVLVNQGDDNIYLAKFNGAGNLLWAKSYGASGHDDASSVATDTSGNIYIAGSFTSTNIMFDGITMPSGGGYTGFVVKLDNGGNALWAKKIDRLYTLANLKIKASISEDVFVTGYFNSSALLFTPTDSLVNKGLFLAKYDNNGSFKWARDALGGTRATGITLDAAGNPCISGYFGSDTLNFDSATLLNDTTPGLDIFVAAINILSSVEEYNVQNIKDFWVFPNPSQGRFYLKTKGNQSIKILIYDMMGKEKFSKTINHEMEQIDLSSCAKGIYFVTINTKGSIYTKKIIIQ